ncbi:MAG: gamma-glutamyl-gamma-aminobutyrate hydrolase family protein [Anaerolinea sp.]|nr:gamma-glutamyl-gamma-aminobutyrate hydrolase family protein [Anaerolinea sp.]
MARPLIGIVAALHRENRLAFYGLLPAYTQAVAEAGGLPVMIVPNLDQASLRDLYDRLDGVLLAGGADIDPALYGMSSDAESFGVYGVDSTRDQVEVHLAQWAQQEDKPLLGICRGAQMINVALGGTLYRDIAKEYAHPKQIDHALWGKFPRDHYGHAVNINPESRLAAALAGETHAPVNSLHHQAIRDLAPLLRVSARSEDDLVEGVEIPDARFFLAVQWHPEELIERSTAMRNLFKAFVDSAR